MTLAALKDAISSGSKALPRDLLQVGGDERGPRHALLQLGSPLDDALPEGGLARSAVIEVSSPLGLSRATSFALQACVAAQRGRATDAPLAWCAWLDPWSTLHAPGVRAAGVELERLLVVRPPTDAIARCAVRVVSSKAFALVVVDLAAPFGLSAQAVRLDRWANVVRRLALAIEATATTVLLLTDATAHRSLPLPVAMRIELERDRHRHTTLRVAKDRHGRLTSHVPVDLDPSRALPPRHASATSLGP